MTRVMLVDDHTSFRQAVAFLIDREPGFTVVGQAGSVAEGRTLLREVSPDICLLDMELPDGEGSDLLPDLYRRCPGASAIVLTGSHRPHNRARSIAAGAVGFLPKAASIPEIIVALRKVVEGQPLIPPQEAVALMREATQYDARFGAERQALNQLSPREIDVLKALARGYDNQTIADELSLTTATVRSHVASILSKLEVDSRLQAALIAVHHGLTVDDRSIP